jgi:hypothetical protein
MKGVNDEMPNNSNTALPQDCMAGMPHRRIAALPAYSDAGTPQSDVAVCSFYCMLLFIAASPP